MNENENSTTNESTSDLKTDDQNQNEVDAPTQPEKETQYEEVVSMKFDFAVNSIAQNYNENTIQIPSYSFEITRQLTNQAIPKSFLGLLRTRVTSPRLKALILVEMISIIFKRELDAKLKLVKEPQEGIKIVVQELNSILGFGSDPQYYYDNLLKPKIMSEFELDDNLVAVSHDSTSTTNTASSPPSYSGSNSIYRLLNSALFFQLVRSICDSTGIEFSATARAKLLDLFNQFDNKKQLLYGSVSLSASMSATLPVTPSSPPTVNEVVPGDIVRLSLVTYFERFNLELEDQAESLDGSRIMSAHIDEIFVRRKILAEVLSSPVTPSEPPTSSSSLSEISANKSRSASSIVGPTSGNTELTAEQRRSSLPTKLVAAEEEDDEWIVLDGGKHTVESIPIPSNVRDQPPSDAASKFRWYKQKLAISASKLRETLSTKPTNKPQQQQQ